MSNELEKPTTAAFELADFEIEAPSAPTMVPAVRWSLQKYDVAQMLALSGESKTEISKQTKVPVATINNWLKNKEFSDYVNSILLESVNEAKSLRLKYYLKILKAREDIVEESGDWAHASSKDTLDILKELRAETEEQAKKEDSNYAKLLEKLVLNSNPPKVIDTPANKISE